MKPLLTLLLAGAAALAQPVVPIPANPYPQIRAYLLLTQEQLAKMQQQINDYNRYFISRQQRIATVQQEIAEETAKSPLDPMALGVRYAELEAIRRELAERSDALVPANVALLNETQKAKLKTLEEALKLASTGSEAQSLRLLSVGCVIRGVLSPNPINPVAILDPIATPCNIGISGLFLP